MDVRAEFSMSVIYMLKLEQHAESYHDKFTELTEGINLKIHDWIAQRTSPNAKVLDVGCGPGSLLKKLAIKGIEAFGIDQNMQMVAETLKIRESNPDLKIFADQKDALSIPPIEQGYDAITSTFMLSELRYFERLGFIYHAWDRLKPGGFLFLAEEFIPKSFARIPFYLKRWWFSKKIKNINRRITQPLSNNVEEMCTKIGFTNVDKKSWKMGAFRVYQFQKPTGLAQSNLYLPNQKPWKGFRKVADWMRCLFTGQIDHVSVEPGIYKAGNPGPDSLIIVTANYVLTYNRVMSDLKGIDAWVLCVDSDGINVWCAARGNNFGNKQLIEAIKYSKIHQLTKNKIAILPQLSAGGIALPTLPKDLEMNFKFGPVWSKDIKNYLEKQSMKKTRLQSIVNFDLSKRLEAGLSHVSFLFRSFFFLPTIALLIASKIFQSNFLLPIIAEVWALLFITNMLFAVCFPIFDKINTFYKKGLLYALLFSSGYSLYSLITFPNFNAFLLLGVFLMVYWMSLFSVFSFSGYTMETSASAIRNEYPKFIKIHKSIFIIGLIFILLGIISQYWPILR